MSRIVSLALKYPILLVTLISVIVLTALPVTQAIYDAPDDIEYCEYTGSSSDPLSAWYCKISTNSTVWWHELNYTVTFRIRASFKVSEVGIQHVNVTRLLLRLFIDTRYIPLMDVNFTPQVALPNITSHSSPYLEYDIVIPYNITLTNYAFIHSIHGPKVEANLVFGAWLNTDGETKFLSNYYDSGVRGWESSEFLILIDNPLERTHSTLVLGSILLLPGVIYCFGMLLKMKRRESRFIKYYDKHDNLLFYLSMFGLGFYITIVFALTYGPVIYFFYPAWKYWFSGLIVLLGGLSIFHILPGFESKTTRIHDQHHRYAEIAQLVGIQYRTKSDLETTWLSWTPDEEDKHTYRLSSSKYGWILLFVVSILCFIGSFSSIGVTHYLSIGLYGLCFYLVMQSSIEKHMLEGRYKKWRKTWNAFWNLMYVLVAPTELVVRWLNPVQDLRTGVSPSPSDYELLKKALEPRKSRSIKSHQTPEAIRTASLIWFNDHVLAAKIDGLKNNQLKMIFEDIVMPFKNRKSNWLHPRGSEYLLRRAAFTIYGLELARWAPTLVEDASQLLLNAQHTKAIGSHHIVSRVSEHYEANQMIPESYELPSMRSLMALRFAWVFISLAAAFPVSEIIWSFI